MEDQFQDSNDSPLWGTPAKVVVAVLTLLLSGLVAYRFQSLIAQLVVAVMVAYILNPLIAFVNKRTTVSRGVVTLVSYLLLAVLVGWALVSLGVAAFQQVSSLIEQIPDLISDLLSFIEILAEQTEPIVVGGFEFVPKDIPWDSITNQILGLAEPALGRGGQLLSNLARTTIGWVGMLFFVFVISIYVANEIPKMGSYIGDFAQRPGYRKDAERLMRDFGHIWSAYLRGQVLLGLTIFVVVWTGLSILGVQNALALGLLSGLLEFIPILGPTIGSGAAMIVALFQPANYWDVPGWQFALMVLGLMFVIQQLENNILVPAIVGESLDMHPLLVMVSVFMGGSLAGILGAILAAPVAATLKLIGSYAWRKMFDLPPFPDPEPEPPPQESRRRRLLMKLVALAVQAKDRLISRK